MNITDLKEKPLWQMTGEEFLFLQQNAGQPTVQPPLKPDTSKNMFMVFVELLNYSVAVCRPPTVSNKAEKSTRLLHKSDVRLLLMQSLRLN